MDIERIIIDAITRRKAISITYDNPNDYATGLRICYPHALYYTSSTKKTKVDAYQISGDSSSGVPAWKPFDIEYISGIEILENKTLIVQSDYNPNSNRYKNCIVKI